MADKLKDHEDWGGVAVKQGSDPKKRLAELKAKAPLKREKVAPFAKIGLTPAARFHSFELPEGDGVGVTDSQDLETAIPDSFGTEW